MFDVSRSVLIVRRSTLDVEPSMFGVDCSALIVRRSALDVEPSMFGVDCSAFPSLRRNDVDSFSRTCPNISAIVENAKDALVHEAVLVGVHP